MDPVPRISDDRQRAVQDLPAGRATTARTAGARPGLRDADGTLRVAPAGVVERELPHILVRIEMRARQAWITLQPGEYVSPATVQAGLDRAQITFGIDAGAIAEAGRPALRLRSLMVAQGLPALDGCAASLEHLIDEFAVPQLAELASVDFPVLARQQVVDAATPLICLVPATPGRPGTNIFGRCLPARPGSAIDLATYSGAGTQLSPLDAQVVESAISGRYHRDGTGRVRVLEPLLVPGDVEQEIDSRQPVLIMGSIRKGFRVKSAGDIIVHGCIEDARVTSQGNLLVQGGIRAGEMRVKAHGDLVAGSITGRMVKARNVCVLTTVNGGTIQATGTVTAMELAGGSVVAARGVHCERLGSSLGLPTRIEVGADPYLRCQEEQAEARQLLLERQAAVLKERCSLAAHRMNAHALDAASIELAGELRRLVGEYRLAMQRLAEMNGLIRTKAERNGRAPPPIAAAITVLETVFSGVALVLGPLTRVIEQPVHRPRFVLAGGRITW